MIGINSVVIAGNVGFIIHNTHTVEFYCLTSFKRYILLILTTLIF